MTKIKKTYNYLVAPVAAFALLGANVLTAVAAGQTQAMVDYSKSGNAQVIIVDDQGEIDETFSIRGEETRVVTEIMEETGMSRFDATSQTKFNYEQKSFFAVDAQEDDIKVNVMVLKEGQTLVEVWINSSYSNYWIKTTNVIEALEMAAEVYRVPVRYFEDALVENKFALPTLMQVENDFDDPRVEGREMAAVAGYTFYVYQGDGRASIMAYNNGALKESYQYESDNRSEIVAQLALRYSMSESELMSRTTFESDGVDNVDLENRMGRDDNLDPHEGDNRVPSNQTPVAGF